MNAVKRTFKYRREGKGKKTLSTQPDVPLRVPRVAKLMALAIRFDQLIRDGVVRDQAELARLGYVSPARLSQVMALLNLAPDIQEAILFLPLTERGRDAITERDLRVVVAEVDWCEQRELCAAFFRIRSS